MLAQIAGGISSQTAATEPQSLSRPPGLQRCAVHKQLQQAIYFVLISRYNIKGFTFSHWILSGQSCECWQHRPESAWKRRFCPPSGSSPSPSLTHSNTHTHTHTCLPIRHTQKRIHRKLTPVDVTLLFPSFNTHSNIHAHAPHTVSIQSTRVDSYIQTFYTRMDTLRLEAVCLLKIKEHKDLELRIGTTKISQVPLINSFGHDTSLCSW